MQDGTLYIGLVAVDEKRGIGKNNQLLVHLPKDLAFFKQMTLNHSMIVGAKTLESFPFSLPLPHRQHFVLTKDVQKKSSIYRDKFQNLSPEKARNRQLPLFFENLDSLKNFLSEQKLKQVFLIGGASVYAQCFECCHAFYVTEIQADLGADVFFPNLSSCFERYAQSPSISESGYTYSVVLYLNKKYSLSESEKEALCQALPKEK